MKPETRRILDEIDAEDAALSARFRAERVHYVRPVQASLPLTCTCHPDDNPPRPCPQKYALSECEAAAAAPHPQSDRMDGQGEQRNG